MQLGFLMGCEETLWSLALRCFVHKLVEAEIGSASVLCRIVVLGNFEKCPFFGLVYALKS